MADVKISELTAQASASVDVSADVLALVDTSVPQTKKISVENLLSPITIDKSAGTITSLGTIAGNVVINKASNPTYLQIGSSLTDDPYMVFQSDGNTFAMGIDRSDSNRFKISDNATLGTNDRFVIESDGTAVMKGATQFEGNTTVTADNARFGVGASASGHWASGFDVLSVGHATQLACETADSADRNAFWTSNIYYDGTGSGDNVYRRLYTDEASMVQQRAGTIRFFTNTSGTADADFAPTERMRITADGKVGIHTTSPNVAGANDERGVLTISSTDKVDANNYAILELQGHSFNDQGALGAISFLDHSTNCASIQVNTEDNSQNSGRMTFATKTAGGSITERMRIGSNGKIGINTTNTNSVINIPTVAYQNSAGPDQGIRVHNPDTAADAVFQPIENSDYLDWYWGCNTYFATNASYARFDSNRGTAAIFLSSANHAIFMFTGGTGQSPQQRFRIDENGVVYISNLYGRAVGGTNRDVYVGDGGDLGYLSSVREHKMDITSLSDVSWLDNLNPVSFYRRNQNEDGTYGSKKDGRIEYGLIADEVESVNDDFVFYDEDEDGNQSLAGVQYRQLMIPMLKKIQQLETRIAELENA